MSCTYEEARDGMFTLVMTAWANARTLLVLPYDPEMRFQGVEYRQGPDLNVFWGRLSTQIVIEGLGAIGVKNYDSAGLLQVQLFGPMSGEGQVWAKLSSLADLVLNSIRGKKCANGSLWLRNERRQDNLGPDGKFQRINIVAEFQFNQLLS